MNSGIIDSHCHLTGFQDDLEGLVAQCREVGVTGMIAVGTDSGDWPVYQEMASGFPGTIFATAGLHPCHVKEDWEAQLELLAEYSPSNGKGVVALGECGLDYFHLPKDPQKRGKLIGWQKEAFRQQLKMAARWGVPLVVHSRNAFEDTLAMIDASEVNPEKVVFHCFSEGPEAMKALRERGARGSFTGILTYRSAGNVREAMMFQGADVLMVETDSPYLSPEPHRGKSNDPSRVAIILDACASLLGESKTSLQARVWKNTLDFFGLKITSTSLF